MFISFYITDSKNFLIFQYLLSSSSPTFSHLWTKIQTVCPELTVEHNNESAKGELPDDNDLNNYTRAVHGSLGKDLEVYKYRSSVNKLNYFCLTSRPKGGASVEPFIFLEALDRILLEYFEKDQLTVSKLANNYDRLAMIFYMCVDAGEPAVGRLHENIIKRMVPTRSDLSKIITSTASSFQKAVQRQPLTTKSSSMVENSSGFNNDNNAYEHEVVPWRTGNLKYVDNEIYVDMLETIHVVFSKKQRRRTARTSNLQSPSGIELVCGTIGGQMNFRSHLSDNPLVEIRLDLAGNYLGIPALHEAIELENGDPKNLDVLRFVPPDGKCSLMEYAIDLDMLQAKQSNYKHGNIGLISVDFKDELGNKKDEFEITLNVSSSRKVSNVKDLKVEVQVIPERKKETTNQGEAENSEQQEGADDSATADIEYRLKALRNTHGRFENCVTPGRGTWIFDNETPVGALPVLRGCLEYGNQSSPSLFGSARVAQVSISYNYTGQLASGIQVQGINLVSGVDNVRNMKLFKGVKYFTKTGDFTIRGGSTYM